MVVSRSRFHMVDTCCLSVISFRLQTKDTIEKTGCKGEAMWSSWTHTVLAFLFTFHDVKWSLGTVMTKSSKFVTATTTWNWKNWKNWNKNILYTLETSSTNFTLDLVQISLISTLPLGQLKVCFFGAKTNKGQTNHDTIILFISSIFIFSDFFDPFPIFPRVLAASRLYSIVTCAVKLGALWGRSRQAFYSRSWYPRLYKTQLHLIKDLNTQWVYDIGLYILVC